MINIHVDVEQFTAGMSELQEKQLPFATKNALNAVAMDVQVRERARLREVFTLRRQQWADRSVKIEHFATKTEQFATIGITPPGGNKDDILGKFEDDTQKTAQGSHGIAVPIDARRNKGDLVVASQKPKAFNLHREGSRIIGDNGTYIVDIGGGRQLLIQRKDLGKRAAKKAGRGTAERGTVLFLFVPRVRINPDLAFVPNAQQVVDRMWEQRFSEAMAQALATAVP